jgi:hypothetical protein
MSVEHQSMRYNKITAGNFLENYLKVLQQWPFKFRATAPFGESPNTHL